MIKLLFPILGLALLTSARAQTNISATHYLSGAETAINIGRDLYSTLDAKYQKTLDPQTVDLEPGDNPLHCAHGRQSSMRAVPRFRFHRLH